MDQNRTKLKIILKAVLFCARQNIALRGHRDDSQHYMAGENPGNNPGNFQELLKLMQDCGNSQLTKHFQEAPHNATYRSKTIQNEFINIAAKQIKDEIVKERNAAKEFSILADEACDVSCREQLALVIRFVDHNSVIREEFLGYLHCADGTSGEALSDLILKELKTLNIVLRKCVFTYPRLFN